jgi:hypothetical protein
MQRLISAYGQEQSLKNGNPSQKPGFPIFTFQCVKASARSARCMRFPGLWSFGSFRKDKQAAEGDFTSTRVGEINRT